MRPRHAAPRAMLIMLPRCRDATPLLSLRFAADFSADMSPALSMREKNGLYTGSARLPLLLMLSLRARSAARTGGCRARYVRAAMRARAAGAALCRRRVAALCPEACTVLCHTWRAAMPPCC